MEGPSLRLDWLPESDAPQNGNGLIFEFPFGLLNTIKGEKRILSREFLLEAAYTRIKRPKTWFVKDRLKLAQECLQLLHDCPALTRRELARQLLMTTARFNQILSLHGLAPQIQREIFSLNPVGERRLTERPLLLLLKLDSMAQIKEFRRLFRS